MSLLLLHRVVATLPEDVQLVHVVGGELLLAAERSQAVGGIIRKEKGRDEPAQKESKEDGHLSKRKKALM